MLRRLAVLCALGLVGLAYTPTAHAADADDAQIGLAAGLLGGNCIPVQVRIQLNNHKMMIGPEFGFSAGDGAVTALTFGCGFAYNFIRGAGDAVGVGGVFAVSINSTPSGTTFQDGTTSKTSIVISPGIQGEHWFSDHFSVIGEFGLPITTSPFTISTSPQVGVKVAVYF